MTGPAIDPSEPIPSIRGLPRGSWRYAARRTIRGFWRHRGLDAAAALTFYAALALFPGALVVVSVFALASGGKPQAVDRITDVLGEFALDSTVDTVRGPLEALLNLPNPGIALVIGIVLSIYTVSSYATSFGRALNSVYEVQEGRRFWKFRALMILLAIVVIVGFALIGTILLGTPTVVDAVVANTGLSPAVAWTWNIAKWPILVLLAFTIIGLLYYYTPNVRHLRIRWVTLGAAFAMIAWGLATTGFGLYIVTFDAYNRVYGWLGGAIAMLVWLYITNLALVLGAEADAEIVRLRQLGAGIEAESTIRLPLRDTARNLTLARQQNQDEAAGKAIREKATRQPSSRRPSS